MTRVLIAVLCACGSKSAPAPVSNTASSSATPAPSDAKAKVHQRTQNGGVVELIGDRSAAMTQANDEISAHCGPGNYTIVREGEERIIGGGGATGWLVHYQCAGTAGQAP